jgi:hypothetical protein
VYGHKQNEFGDKLETQTFKTRELAAEFLRGNPGTKFTARELAKRIVDANPQLASSKMSSSAQGLQTLEEVAQQVAAEIGAGRPNLTRLHGITATTDRPRLYYFDPDGAGEEESRGTPTVEQSFGEAETYPLLKEYLETEKGLAALRIDERRSSGKRGSGSGHWLHPDLVAIEDLSQGWVSKETKALNKFYKSDSIRIWAFEVKRSLSVSNARSSYFQAVSNSGWANFGYLVATTIDERAFEEIEVLFGVHGIGLIKLDVEEPLNSQILIPSRERPKLDWNSADRLADENPDFARLLKALETLHLTNDFEMMKSLLRE